MAGLKKDVRSSANSQQWITDGKSKLVTPEQGLYVSQMIHANNYCECSARTCEVIASNK